MSKLLTTSDFQILSDRIRLYKPKFIVIEGYNAVGKSVLLEKLVEVFNFRVYRPDYNSWANKIPREYRWAIFSSFMNISSEMKVQPKLPILFDRGIFSGVVYNNDLDLARIYNSIVGDYFKDILHVLITCGEEDYKKFLEVRGSDKYLSYEDCLDYTNRYINAFEQASVNYIIYNNKFDNRRNSADTCLGCSHYTFHTNSCNNPVALNNGITNVSSNRKRCEYSNMREVQDSGRLQELFSLSK